MVYIRKDGFQIREGGWYKIGNEPIGILNISNKHEKMMFISTLDGIGYIEESDINNIEELDDNIKAKIMLLGLKDETV